MPRTRSNHAARLRFLLAPAAPLLVVLAVAATVCATTPPYADGWYRLYDDCQMEALREVAAFADRDPGVLVVAGSWQAKLALAALTDNASRVWFASAFFSSEAMRSGLATRAIVAVDEPHLATESPKADLAFLANGGWTPLGQWCGGASGPTVAAFFHPPGASPS